MKKLFAMLLVAAMTLSLCACGGSSNSAAPAAAEKSTAAASTAASSAAADTQEASEAAAPAADGTVYTFRIDDPNPETATCSIILEDWKDWVYEKSNGQLVMEVYHNAQLGNIADCVTNCLAGISDGFWSAVSIYGGVFPVTSGIQLPMLGVRNCEVGSAVLMDLLRTTDYMDAEYYGQGLFPVAIHAASTYTILIANGNDYADKAFTFDDFAGLKMRTVSAELSDWATKIGAVPVSISSNEGYENLEKGVINAAIFDHDKIYTSHLLEVTDCLLDCHVSVPNLFLCLNQEKVNQLPEELQQVLKDSGDFFISELRDGYQQWIDANMKQAEELGIPSYTLDDETLDKMQAAAEETWQGWIESMNAQGYDGQAIFDKYQELIEKYNAVYDYDA